MSRLNEYFNNDFKNLSLELKIPYEYSVKNNITGETTSVEVEIYQRLHHHGHSSARFFTFYIPETILPGHVCRTIINSIDYLKEKGTGLDVIQNFSDDVTIGIHSIVFSNRIYIYSESQLNEFDINEITEIAVEKKIFVTIRSKNYVDKKMEVQTPTAFISHDSRDKEIIAKKLADGLNSRLCFTWYDEYSLKVGDSLRESIEKGIKEVKKCVLIITPNFLNNPGWTKKEFNSIFTREMIFNERIVLPIWYKVSKKDVYEYSPTLADTVALIWPDKEEYIDEEIYKKEIEKIISKLHTVITE